MANDEALVPLALAGDRKAFEALVESYWPVAERVAREILNDAQLAQDVAQDVFADIYVQRARYQPRFSFHAYVLGDNRANSNDSHLIGPLKREQIVAHVRCVLFPLSGIRAIQ